MQELSLNVLDVAQNSITAGANLVQITVDEQAAGQLTIVIKDNGCGMEPDKAAKVTDPFFTTRTTRKVGLGLPFFKMAAEMTGGGFTIWSKPGVGTTVTAKFNTKHIDCMPMGDICATVSALIQCNPDIDFLYSYSYNGKSFAADTREFRQVLEGIPLNTPQVLQFVKEYIDENTAAVQAN